MASLQPGKELVMLMYLMSSSVFLLCGVLVAAFNFCINFLARMGGGGAFFILRLNFFSKLIR